MLSLYSYAFGSYGATFFPENDQTFWRHILTSAVIISFTLLNLLSAKVVGRSEEVIVVIKILILVTFVAVGLWSVQFEKFEISTWSEPLTLIAGGMIIFLACEGFELIANTAGDVKNPKKTLPRAFYTLLSTGSAINVTLYGASRISYIITKTGDLPKQLEQKIWNRPIEGLIITSVFTLLVANLFDLTSIAIMGSAGFLLIFAAVNFVNFRLHKKTHSRR